MGVDMDMNTYQKEFIRANKIKLDSERLRARRFYEQKNMSHEELLDMVAFTTSMATVLLEKATLTHIAVRRLRELSDLPLSEIEEVLSTFGNLLDGVKSAGPLSDYSRHVFADLDSLLRIMKLGSSLIAKKNANKAHSEHHSLKNDAIDWMDKSYDFDLSMDKNAEKLKTIVPVSFRTARKWVGEWKKVRFASKE